MSDPDDRKSTSGYMFICNGGAVSWKSFKKSIIVDLIMKVEYIAASKVAKKIFWFKKFVMELDVIPSDAIALHCNNNGTIALTKELRFHQKSKHIERWFHIICEYLKNKFVEVQRVNFMLNMADSLIKHLSQQKIEAHLEKMDLRYMIN